MRGRGRGFRGRNSQWNNSNTYQQNQSFRNVPHPEKKFSQKSAQWYVSYDEIKNLIDNQQPFVAENTNSCEWPKITSDPVILIMSPTAI